MPVSQGSDPVCASQSVPGSAPGSGGIVGRRLAEGELEILRFRPAETLGNHAVWVESTAYKSPFSGIWHPVPDAVLARPTGTMRLSRSWLHDRLVILPDRILE